MAFTQQKIEDHFRSNRVPHAFAGDAIENLHIEVLPGCLLCQANSRYEASVRRVYSEHVPWNVLDRPLIKALARSRAGIDLAVAVFPSQVPRLPALALRCRDMDVRLVVWPLLEDSLGRWASTTNTAEYEELLARIFRDVPASVLLLDLEPPIAVTRRWLDLRPAKKPTLQAPPKRTFGGLATWARREGWQVEAVVPPVIAYGAKWEKRLGTPVSELGCERVESMAYTSLFEGYGRGLIDRRVARDLLSRIAGRSNAISLGVVGGGALGDEQAYRSVEELIDDVGVARAAGVERLSLYGLDGILERGPIEPWLNAFTRSEALKRMPQRTRRGALLDAVSRVLG